MSSPYPIEVESVSLKHRGGTKAYFVKIFICANGKAVVVFRWGKVGNFGDVMVELFQSHGDAWRCFEKKVTEKRGRGYSPEHIGRSVTCDNIAALKKEVGAPLLPKIGAKALLHLDPDYPVKGLVDAPSLSRFDEDGNFLGDRASRATLDRATDLKERQRQEAEAARIAEEEAASNHYKSNPVWGRF